MKIIYKANDGTEFDTAEQCTAYESLNTEAVKAIQALWTESPFSCSEFIIINIKEINSIIDKYTVDKQSEEFKVLGWSILPSGTSVRVKNNEMDEWIYGVLVAYHKIDMYPFRIKYIKDQDNYVYQSFKYCELV